ncbi:hypothetical protein BJ742DRAFT_767768 [Cladochytrium replicatum]|nr:hypothetical protein BJ742DRAFT_767768 [Cladochytrium replicatum]
MVVRFNENCTDQVAHRFALEVVKAAIQGVGGDSKRLAVKLSPGGVFRPLVKNALIKQRHHAPKLSSHIPVLQVMFNGGFTGDEAEQFVKSGKADLAAPGPPSSAHPTSQPCSSSASRSTVSTT